jgi:hypothetical protein
MLLLLLLVLEGEGLEKTMGGRYCQQVYLQRALAQSPGSHRCCIRRRESLRLLTRTASATFAAGSIGDGRIMRAQSP